MTSARKIKVKLAQSKPRNPVVASLAKSAGSGRAGKHQKSKSAERQAQKRALQRVLGAGQVKD